ncbi:di-trans,poly-cis-decaprenylcistransferase [Candidatus Uhrbacteria bacterium CG10_big_fil_rev_8_21_14_0_10_48_11]|uniref:Isoprenyl transferase n=1 Tax=Candidatus Uhrbacteria bacterium CG10_big_fil_rev_8_21_14_0_10_48_11 TaxID=1975037 RepID=A0A2M8LEX3_9BACT|nr:MAG: di-trans,poly-cis-decaprenylcistransferase [Candidatus Uhrbacteria bacterium CG10_big_fil_rev_8_21_14_0_10_48_11]
MDQNKQYEKRIPGHIAFIMDGNRRWAKARNLPTFEGHRRGYKKLKEVGAWCLKRGIKETTVYAFSTENWNREAEEVTYLMKLLRLALTEELGEFSKQNLRLKIIGSRERLDQKLIEAIERAERQTAANTAGSLSIALNYGGRAEILDALRAMVRDGMDEQKITEATIRKYLYAPEASDPDMIIRTGGEQRLSNFLSWQSVYSELYFIEPYWPDFSEAYLDGAFAWYAARERRHGK